jgi:hypothetical protein
MAINRSGNWIDKSRSTDLKKWINQLKNPSLFRRLRIFGAGLALLASGLLVTTPAWAQNAVASNSGVTVSVNHQTAAAAVANNLRAYVRDSAGKPVNGVVVTFSATPGVSFSQGAHPNFMGGGSANTAATCTTGGASYQPGACDINAMAQVAATYSTTVSISQGGGTAPLSSTGFSVGSASANDLVNYGSGAPVSYTFIDGPVPAPGGVRKNLAMWVKSDVNGGNGTAPWPELVSGFGLPVKTTADSDSTARGEVKLNAADSSHNFYPSYGGFSARGGFFQRGYGNASSQSCSNPSAAVYPYPGNYGGAAPGPFSGYVSSLSIFSAVYPTSAGTGRITGTDNEDPANFNTAAEPYLSLKNGIPQWYSFTLGKTLTGASSITPFQSALVNTITSIDGESGVELYLDHNSTGALGISPADNITSVGCELYIGQGSWNLSGAFPGDIMEVIYYTKALSPTEQLRVNSYLAIKNGVTLSPTATGQAGSPYLASSGNTVWDSNAKKTYNYRVFGLAKDPASALNQDISNSTQITSNAGLIMSTDRNFTGAVGTHAGLGAGQFLMVGDNNAAATLSASFAGASQIRMSRVWQAQNTGSVEGAYFAIPTAGTSRPPHTLAMLVSVNDASFSSEDVTFNPMSIDGQRWVTDSSAGVPDEAFFTFVQIGPALASASGVVTAANDAVADGLATNRLQVRLNDSNGLPVSRTVVTFAATPGVAFNGGAVGAAATCKTSANGVCSIIAASTIAGSYETAVTLNGQPLTGQFTKAGIGYGPSPASYRFVAGSPTVANSGVTTTTNHATADGAATHSLQAMVRDRHDNPVTGAVVTFSATPHVAFNGGQIGAAATCMTTSAGMCSVTATSTVAVAYTTEVTLTGQALAGKFTHSGTSYGPSPVNYTFTAGAASAKTSGVGTTVNKATADGTTSNALQVLVRDAHNNAVTGAAITFGATPNVAFNNGAVGAAAQCTTTSTGICSITATSKKAARYVTTVTLNGQALAGGFTHGATVYGPSPAAYTFVAGTASAASSGVVVTTDQAEADGNSADTVLAMVRDSNGNPISDAVLTFAATEDVTFNGSNAGAPATCTTAPNGTCSVSAASTKAGSFTTAVTLNGVALSGHFKDEAIEFEPSPANYAFVPGAPSLAASGVITTEDNAAADETGKDMLQAIVRDSHNNPVAGSIVTFAATPNVAFNGTTAGEPATCTTGAGGVCTVTATSTSAGSFTTAVTLNGEALSGSFTSGNTSYGPSPASYTFVAGEASAATSGVIVTVNNATADGASTNAVQAMVRDRHGNPVAGAMVTFAATTGVAFNGGNLGDPATCTTALTGICSVTATSTMAKSYTTAITLNGLALSGSFNMGPTSYGASPATYTFVGGAAVATTSGVVVTANNASADGTNKDILQAIVRDSHNNPIAGKVVTFAAIPNVSFNDARVGEPANCTTTSEGICSVTATSTSAGSYTTVVTLDGAALSGSFTSGDIAYGPSPASFAFVAGEASAASSGVLVAANDAAADGKSADTLQAMVRDSHGNPIVGTVVTFAETTNVAFNGGKLGAPATCTTAAAGTCSVTATSETAGSYTTVVTLNGVALSGSFTSGTTSYGPGPASYTFVAGVASAASSGVFVAANDAAADGKSTDTLQAMVRDRHGNPVVGAVVTFAETTNVAFNGGKPGEPATCTTTSTGICSMTATSETAGSFATAVTLKGEALSGTFASGNTSYGPSPASYTFVAGDAAAATSGVVVAVNNAMADGKSTDTLQAMVRDRHGNPVVGAVVTFAETTNVAFNGGKPGEPATCTTTSTGICSVTATSETAGSSTTVVTLKGEALSGAFTINNTSYGSSPASFTFVAGEAVVASSGVVVTANYAAADGSATNTLQAMVRDDIGNPVAGAVVTFAGTRDVSFNGSAAGSASNCTTTSTVECSVAATSYISGRYTTVVTLKGQALAGGFVKGSTIYEPSPVNYVFVAGAASPAASGVATTANHAVADGRAVNTFEALVRDGHGNPVAGAVLTFAATPKVAFNGGAAGAPAHCSTGLNGRCSVTATSLASGRYSTAVTLDGDALSGTFTHKTTLYGPSPVGYEFAPAALPVPPTPVPTLSPWMLVLLSLVTLGLVRRAHGRR